MIGQTECLLNDVNLDVEATEGLVSDAAPVLVACEQHLSAAPCQQAPFLSPRPFPSSLTPSPSSPPPPVPACLAASPSLKWTGHDFGYCHARSPRRTRRVARPILRRFLPSFAPSTAPPRSRRRRTYLEVGSGLGGFTQTFPEYCTAPSCSSCSSSSQTQTQAGAQVQAQAQVESLSRALLLETEGSPHVLEARRKAHTAHAAHSTAAGDGVSCDTTSDSNNDSDSDSDSNHNCCCRGGGSGALPRLLALGSLEGALGGSSVDGVVGLMVLDCLQSDAELWASVKDIAAVLRPGCSLVHVVDVNPEPTACMRRIVRRRRAGNVVEVQEWAEEEGDKGEEGALPVPVHGLYGLAGGIMGFCALPLPLVERLAYHTRDLCVGDFDETDYRGEFMSYVAACTKWARGERGPINPPRSATRWGEALSALAEELADESEAKDQGGEDRERREGGLLHEGLIVDLFDDFLERLSAAAAAAGLEVQREHCSTDRTGKPFVQTFVATKPAVAPASHARTSSREG